MCVKLTNPSRHDISLQSSSPLSQRTAVAAQGMPAMVLPARRRVWGSMCCRAASGRSASGKCLTLSPGKRLALAGMRLFRSLMAREWRLRMKHGLELWFVVLHPHPQCGKILAPTIRDPEVRRLVQNVLYLLPQFTNITCSNFLLNQIRFGVFVHPFQSVRSPC